MNFKTQSLITLYFTCLCTSQLASVASEASTNNACLEKLSAEDKKTGMAIMESCKKKLNLDKIPTLDEIEKNNFEDKCLSKCKLTELKFIDDKGAIDIKTVQEFTKKVAPDKQTDVLNLWQACSESIMKTMEGEGGINETSICRAIAMLRSCFMKGVIKFC